MVHDLRSDGMTRGSPPSDLEISLSGFNSF